jgi:hypothetical protein
MQRSRFIFTAVLTLIAAGAWAAEPQVLVDLDFSKAEAAGQVQINGTVAAIVEEDGKARLRLTDAGSQAGSFFIKTPLPAVSDYLATLQFEVKSLDGAAPADGFAFVSQVLGPDKLGDGGGGIGYSGAAMGSRSYAIEFNSYSGQGGQSVAWDAFGVRTKFNQSPFEHVDKGPFSAEMRVLPKEVTVTVSGGSDNMAPTMVMKTTLLVTDMPDLEWFKILAPAPQYFGVTAGTGGSAQITDIYSLRIVAPGPAPADGGTTPPPADGGATPPAAGA